MTVPVKFTTWTPKVRSLLFRVHVPLTIRGSEFGGESAKLGEKMTGPSAYEFGEI